jgi:protease secretion system outer membrane protein
MTFNNKNPKKHFLEQTLPQTLLIFLALSSPFASAYALDLTSAFELAKAYDPKFQAAKNEETANNADSIAGRLSYLPALAWNQSQPSTINYSQKTTSMSQPIFDATKLAAVAQGGARKTFASANFNNQAIDLAQRIVTAVQQIVVASEAIKANDTTISALESQYIGSKRKFELGQGTVTDMLDVQVKFEQAKANALTLKANLKAAQNQFNAITGEYPTGMDFLLPHMHQTVILEPLESVLSKASEENTAIIAAKANERISQLGVVTASAAVLPTVSYTWQRISAVSQPTQNNNGVTVTIPLNAAAYANTYSAVAKARQSSDNRLATEVDTKAKAENLYAQVEAGFESLKIRNKAMDSAKLSVTANQKSYEAGVKTTTDVLLAIQNLAQTRNDYAQAATQQALNYLNLLLVAAEDPDKAVAKTQAFLFRK